MGSDLDALRDVTIPGDLTHQQVHAAQQAVCRHARDVEDARLLLDMLGIKEKL